MLGLMLNITDGRVSLQYTSQYVLRENVRPMKCASLNLAHTRPQSNIASTMHSVRY
jgi:hypothetical protein